MSEKCPLCLNQQVRFVDTFSSEALIKLYANKIGLNVREYFREVKEISYVQCNYCKLYFLLPFIVGDDKFYEKLQEKEWYYLAEKKEYEILPEYVKAGDNILEIGSGAGFLVEKLPSHTTYVGLELNKKAIAEAQKRGIDIRNELIQEHIQKNFEKYDVVCAFQLLEHVSDAYEIIQSSIKALKPAGKLIIAVPNHDSFIGRAINNPLNFPPHHISHWPLDTFRKFPDIFPLSLVDIIPIPLEAIHYPWFGKTLSVHSFYRLFKKEFHLINMDFTNYFIEKASGLIGKFLANGLGNNFSCAGHTVVAVFEKKPE